MGTRGSALAMAQSTAIAAQVTELTGRQVELVTITTAGDVSTEPLASMGGVGVFVNALREALLAGEVDFAVHSLKDLPTADASGLVIAAIPQRADPRDALVARDGLVLGELPTGSRVGTGSPRRAAQLHALGLGLEVVGVRGNVDTRLKLVASGELDAVILARAGLVRLGRADEITETLDPIQMLPAPGQGALAVECRDPDTDSAAADVFAALRGLDDPWTRAVVTAERSLLATLEAGCSAPVGALGEAIEGDPETGEEDELYLRATVLATDGTDAVRQSTTGPLVEAEVLGRKLAAEMLADGADLLMQEESA
ncbi:hydroxymethylbilane synthase [Sporichthya sp.]|uniref:hydroxymethylbilane synthase n=1 Tax=Sporichthya sp. TaxID=65475 RepID=UPI0018565BD2|nr:hydroxymethylbilane synthase [Sporichthya sp.]